MSSSCLMVFHVCPCRLENYSCCTVCGETDAAWRPLPCARACNILWFCLSVQNPLFRRLSHLWSTYTLCNPMVPKQHLHRFIYSFVLWYGVRLFPLVRDAP
ncbi:unnamed protein product [Spodoptera exigua]|nr:unnamed protein product [Spodoptera exigua]